MHLCETTSFFMDILDLLSRRSVESTDFLTQRRGNGFGIILRFRISLILLYNGDAHIVCNL